MGESVQHVSTPRGTIGSRGDRALPRPAACAHQVRPGRPRRAGRGDRRPPRAGGVRAAGARDRRRRGGGGGPAAVRETARRADAGARRRRRRTRRGRAAGGAGGGGRRLGHRPGQGGEARGRPGPADRGLPGGPGGRRCPDRRPDRGANHVGDRQRGVWRVGGGRPRAGAQAGGGTSADACPGRAGRPAADPGSAARANRLHRCRRARPGDRRRDRLERQPDVPGRRPGGLPPRRGRVGAIGGRRLGRRRPHRAEPGQPDGRPGDEPVRLRRRPRTRPRDRIDPGPAARPHGRLGAGRDAGGEPSCLRRPAGAGCGCAGRAGRRQRRRFAGGACGAPVAGRDRAAHTARGRRPARDTSTAWWSSRSPTTA